MENHMSSREISRRSFIWSAVALGTAAHIGAQRSDVPDWGAPVTDIHLHLRPTLDGNFNHIQGSGVSRAVLLTNVSAEDHAKEVVAKYPGRFVRFASIDVRQPDAVDRL